MTRLPVPAPDRDACEELVRRHLADLATGPIVGSGRFRGGQRAADAALAAFDVAGYASRRNQVLPRAHRGASALSPYIRHGSLPLRTVWDAVGDGPPSDVGKFRDELLWQEYARHWYARLGARTGRALRRRPAGAQSRTGGWDRTMACVDAALGELHEDGWLVNQTRMWLASEWTVRRGAEWTAGEDEFFRHLLDGSRAANRLGWQWTTGVGSAKPYGFSRRQVRRRAPELCTRCVLATSCPIEDWPDDPDSVAVEPPAALRRADDVGAVAGPVEAHVEADGDGEPDAVWLTAESLGDADPALTAHPGAPVVFVFDEVLLARLQLAAKRLVFLAETLAELAERRDLELHRGDPRKVLAGRRLAVTHAPVPGFGRLARAVRPVAVHPWPWLVRPGDGPVTSFTAWRRALRPSP
jgi:deoxyribodipyrimidine photo-lyase